MIIITDYGCFKPQRYVDIRGWVVSKILFESLGKICYETCVSIRIDKLTGFQPEYLSYLKGFPRLQVLTMAGIMDIDKQVALILSSLHSLEELDIRFEIYYLLIHNSILIFC
jgi:hypothetical protein